MKRDWKRTVPNSLVEAFRLCKDFARERRNLSVERIAELMAITSDLLYKWLGTGRMPANLLPAYEHICGIDFVSRHLAASAGKLVVAMPTGRVVQPSDVQALQEVLTRATAAILDFATGKTTAQHAVADIESGMAALAWHRATIQKSEQPELELDA